MNFIHPVFKLTSQAPELVNVLFVNDSTKRFKGCAEPQASGNTMIELLYICLISGIVSTLPQGRKPLYFTTCGKPRPKGVAFPLRNQ